MITLFLWESAQVKIYNFDFRVRGLQVKSVRRQKIVRRHHAYGLLAVLGPVYMRQASPVRRAGRLFRDLG